MQTIECNAQVKTGITQHQPYASAVKDGRYAMAGKSFRAKEYEDDCSVCDKLPKQMDDIVEGESPQRFKRPKMASDIVAR